MTLQTFAAENLCCFRWGDERTVKCAQMVSKDPHLRDRKFYFKIDLNLIDKYACSLTRHQINVSVKEFLINKFETSIHLVLVICRVKSLEDPLQIARVSN